MTGRVNYMGHILLSYLATEPVYTFTIYVPSGMVLIIGLVLSALGVKAFWR